MDKRLYISNYPEANAWYQASYPVTLIDKIRMAIATTLIKWGLKLTLKNGVAMTSTTASTKYQGSGVQI